MRALQIALQRGSLEELNPTPWIFMTGNCIGWVGYSFLKHDYFILIPNGTGVFISLWLNFGAAKLQYMEKFLMHKQIMAESMSSSISLTPDSDQKNDIERTAITSPGADERSLPIYINLRNSYGISSASQESKVISILVAWLLIFSCLKFFNIDHQIQQLVVGIIVNINLVVFFGAPLSTIFTVLRTRNSSSIHLWTMILNILNTTFWLLYGLSIMDLYICIPNGIGLLLGLAQGALCFAFPRVIMDEEDFSMADSEGDLGDLLMQEEGFRSRKEDVFSR